MRTGADYLPFSEIPSLRNMVLTGHDDEDMSWLQMQDQHAIMPDNAHSDNSTVVPYRGGGRGGAGGGGRPRGGEEDDSRERDGGGTSPPSEG